MNETIKLELQFQTAEGKKRTLAINHPLLELEEAQVRAAMDTISNQKVFKKEGDHLYDAIRGARYVKRTVDNIFQLEI
ncbi:DUF2922 domain-containing protein [Allofustis seminis]|uniref:DUF2922 domain-containing protein n=1 Tax=Allofustis seminis TaxID=166939 RepID=UPI000370E4BB|nr:DUF2922 domain-containing protein [Allofustis seminis]